MKVIPTPEIVTLWKSVWLFQYQVIRFNWYKSIESRLETYCVLKSIQQKANSSLWKRVIGWEQSHTASAYGIIWGDTGQNKHSEI